MPSPIPGCPTNRCSCAASRCLPRPLTVRTLTCSRTEAEILAEATVVRHLVGEAAAIKAAEAAESTTGRTKADKTAVGRADMETAMGTTITTGSTRAHRRAGHP